MSPTGPSSRRRARATATLVALLLMAGVPAGEAPTGVRTQPVLLPMADLLRRLDAREEWMLLPLAEYQRLVAAGQAPDTVRPGGPAGAWIESARISGTLAEDRILRLTADLTLVSTAPAPARCRLFAELPALLGAVEVGGQPGLHAGAPGAAPELLVPGPGRHRASVSWTVRLDAGDDRARRAAVPLPLAAGLDLRLTSSTPGGFSGEALAEDAAGGAWRLARPCPQRLPLAWHPGRLASGAGEVWGLRQSLHVAMLPAAPGRAAERGFRWVARLEPRRGDMPRELRVTLPAGWTAATAGEGVADLAGTSGEVVLRIDPAATSISLDGFLEHGAAIALPGTAGAAYQGGRVTLTSAAPLDYQVPPGWQPVARAEEPRAGGPEAARFARSFVVPGPDVGLRTVSLEVEPTLSSTTSTVLLIGERLWRLEQTLVVHPAPGSLYALPVQLPPGWRVVAFSASLPCLLPGVSDGGSVEDIVPGSLVRIDIPSGRVHGQELRIDLALERAAEAGAGAPVRIAEIAGSARAHHRLLVAAAPGIEVGIATGGGWRLDRPLEPAWLAHGDGAPVALRAELLATGSALPVRVQAEPRPADCTAEAVVYLLPGGPAAAGADTWCRIDLRLAVRAGELEAALVRLPLRDDRALRVTDPAFSLEAVNGYHVLRARQGWRGERLVRIEGRLAAPPGAEIDLPRLLLAVAPPLPDQDAGGTGTALSALLPASFPAGGIIPLRQLAVIQAPGRIDLLLRPGPGAKPIDEDDLPAWSRPFPGEPVFAVYRLVEGAAGGITLVERPLAEAPAGFLDQLSARTQLSAGGTLTLVRARVAAPGLQALPLDLPAGTRLLTATIDGLPVAVRDGPAGAVLPLPGRTQVQVALLLAGPAPTDAADLGLPGFGGLPVTRTAWTVAVDGHWRVRVDDHPSAMPLQARARSAQRRWFTGWRAAVVATDLPATLPTLDPGPATDARALAPDTAPAHPRGEPTLALIGQLYAAERVGGQARVMLALADLDRLRAWDRAGRAVALLLAVWLALRAGWRRQLAFAAAALCLAGALHGWQADWGPLLALAETLPPALIVALLVREAFTRADRRPASPPALGALP